MRRVLAVWALLATLASVPAAAADAKPGERTAEEKAAIARLKESGALVLEVAQNDPRLRSASLRPPRSGRWSRCPRWHVALLNFRGVSSRRRLAKIADFKALTHLHLERTEIDTGPGPPPARALKTSFT